MAFSSSLERFNHCSVDIENIIQINGINQRLASAARVSNFALFEFQHINIPLRHKAQNCFISVCEIETAGARLHLYIYTFIRLYKATCDLVCDNIVQ